MNNNVLERLGEKFADHVAYRTKPGQEVCDGLCANTAHILHMCLGISSELLELSEALLKRDKVNVVEEIGDICFYAVGLAHCINKDLPMNFAGYVFDPLKGKGSDSYSPHEITGMAEVFIDKAKKVAIYNKDIKRADFELDLKSLATLIHRILNLEFQTAEMIQIIMHHNMAKLSERYPNGYQNAAAIARADKN